MEITVKRTFCGPDYTIGKMAINGADFCNTLEDTVRAGAKVYGKTAIPYGTYSVTLNMSPKFGRELPRLIDVPGFDGILIHRGNTAEDTSGCILVGENSMIGRVINSTQYEVELVRLIRAAIKQGEKIFISIIK